jgi:hypothetical protein
VLDDHDGDAPGPDLAEQPKQGGDFRGIEPCRRLVQQQQAGGGGQRARHLEGLALAEGERPGRPPGGAGQADEREALRRVPPRVTDAGGGSAAVEPGDGDVLENGQPGHRADQLERAADAERRPPIRRQPRHLPPAEVDGAAVGYVAARDQVEDGRLAGAVRADQPDDLARPDGQRDAVDRAEPAEGLGQIPCLEQVGYRFIPAGRGSAGTSAHARAARGR